MAGAGLDNCQVPLHSILPEPLLGPSGFVTQRMTSYCDKEGERYMYIHKSYIYSYVVTIKANVMVNLILSGLHTK